MKSIQKGFVSGIALAIAISAMTLLAVHLTDAQGFDTPPAQTAAQPVISHTPAPVTPFSPSNPAPAPTSRPTPAPTTANTIYAALGDSVAAGLGLPLSPNATDRDKQCGRSPQSYPYQVAATLSKPLVDVACSGATAGDLFTKQGVSGPNIPSQLSQAYANGKPSVITITAGANDIEWATFIKKCYASTCGSSFDTTVANGALLALQAKLYLMFADIKLHAGSQLPQVIVTGYYDPLSDRCTAITPQLTAAEITWVRNDVAALNKTLQDVTSHFSFATFVPINFSGHDLCSSDPWVQGLSNAAPVHPNAAGQNAIAQSVISVMNR